MKYCDPAGAVIMTDEAETTWGNKILCDSELDPLFTFPGDWTDKQIMLALDFANQAFERGNRYGIGRSDKAAEIRRAMGMG